jgi:DNA-binding transcriptional regulator YiaG
MAEQKCPVCGSTDIKDEKQNIIINEPFGGKKTVETHEIICSTCGSRGDFFNENEILLIDNIKELKLKSIKNIINDFKDHKISMSAIERALEIPQRTLTKWKNGNLSPSSTGVALMRFLRLFPWLLEVAERKYDYNEAQKIHIKSAVENLLSVVDFDKKHFSPAGTVTASTAIFLNINIGKDDRRLQEALYIGIPQTSSLGVTIGS